MTKAESLTDVPSADLSDVVESFRLADADQVVVIPQSDNKWTVTAIFTSSK